MSENGKCQGLTPTTPAIIAVDVQYDDDTGRACAAGVLFDRWDAVAPFAEHTIVIGQVPAYRSGSFFERELPCIMAVLAAVPEPVGLVIVDGYVDLGPGRPGLGRRLHEALGGKVPVVGVAKTPFRGAVAEEVLRGRSRRCLLVTAAGLPPAEAARLVQQMAGPHRLPLLLKRADTLARMGLK